MSEQEFERLDSDVSMLFTETLESGVGDTLVEMFGLFDLRKAINEAYAQGHAGERPLIRLAAGETSPDSVLPSWDDVHMASEVHAAEESVVLASFANRHAAEHMLASLGREFRKKGRKGEVAAFVVSGNTDGSLKLTQSRVVTAGNVGSALIRVSVSLTVGLMGLVSTLKGAKSGGHAVHVHQAHVGSDEHAAHAILAKAGPDAAIALVCCNDRETRDTVAARAAERASYSWDGSRTEFLADLDPGSTHDWVRTALGDPSSVKR